MEYKAPVISNASETYETPLLLDLEAVSAAEEPCCDTGGGSCGSSDQDN